MVGSHCLLTRSCRLAESCSVDNLALHVPTGTATPYSFREHTFRFLATSQQTGGSYSTMEIVSPHGSGPRPHTHDAAEESFYLLDGEVEFEVDDVKYLVRPGDFIHVPRKAVHHFRVLSPTARMLASYAPGGEEQAFLDAASELG